MQLEIKEKTVQELKGNTWYQVSTHSAVVSGIFSAILLILLVVNYLQISLLDPLRAERLENLKIQLIETPNNEQLLTNIRHLDLQIRKDKISRLDFSRRASFLLLGGLIVFLSSMKAVSVFRQKLTYPQKEGDLQKQQLQQANFARWSVTAGLVIIAVATLLLAARSSINLAESKAGYPSEEELAENWPYFRGYEGSGVTNHKNIPSKWDGKTGDGIIWKSPVPLPGHNSPIIWEDKIFVSGADEKTQQVYCFDRNTGKLLWTGDVETAVSAGGINLNLMEDTGYAASTMTTDGSRVYAIFPTGDVACFDFKGKELWSKNLGTPDNRYGYATSLTMYQNLLLIQYDQGSEEDDKSRLIALDGFTGNSVWEVKRPVSDSWTSPIVIKTGDAYQLITIATPFVISYNPANGQVLWQAKCVTGVDLAPSPIFAGGLVLVIESSRRLIAIKPDGTGDVTETHIAWTADDNIPDICSPVSDGEHIYLLMTMEGTLTCYKVSDGQMLWEKELDIYFQASPSLVGNNLYLMSEDGVMIIAQAGQEYKETARNELGEGVFASPAFTEGRIYIRAKNNLYCIGNN